MLNNSTVKMVADTDRKTLYDVLDDMTQFETHKFHIIKSPPGTGKTYAAVNKLTQLSPDKRLLYLIDTVAGRDGIEEDYKTIVSYEDVLEYDKKACDAFLEEYDKKYDNVAVVMTYAKFGYLMRDNLLNLSDYGVLICDEMQSLMRYMDWDLARVKPAFSKFCKEEHFNKGLPYLCLSYAALDGIVKTYKNGDNGIYVIAITATPDNVKKRIRTYTDIRLSEELEEFKNNNVKDYTSIDDIPYLISKIGKTLIYLQSIEQMKVMRDTLNQSGVVCECLWSPNSKKPLSNQQNKLREYITKQKKLPKKLSVLIINFAYYSSINIKDGCIDTVILHTRNEEIRIQARGRVRHDIENLYLYNSAAPIIKDIPDEFLGMKLKNPEKKQIKEYLNITTENGTQRGFPYIIEHLPPDKYEVIKNKRYTIIKKK